MSRGNKLLLPQAALDDERYAPAAYEFMFEALDFTRRRIVTDKDETVQHVTGAQLVEGMRDLALEQFGLMAMAVLSTWGIRSTSDVGEMVFRLVESGDIRKSPEDNREDFHNLFDFEHEFQVRYEIKPVEPSEQSGAEA